MKTEYVMTGTPDVRVVGRISVYKGDKGYGFIHKIEPDGKLIAYFFHISSVLAGEPKDGLSVLFVPVRDKKGMKATSIVVLGGAQ
jgi:cold shock CspA family protein